MSLQKNDETDLEVEYNTDDIVDDWGDDNDIDLSDSTQSDDIFVSVDDESEDGHTDNIDDENDDNNDNDTDDSDNNNNNNSKTDEEQEEWTPYDIFFTAFFNKIYEYKYMQYDEKTVEEEAVSYLTMALGKFRHYCFDYDFTQRDDHRCVFKFQFDPEDVDEIVDIVSDGMRVYWMSRYAANADNLENFLNTKDYSSYSPANLTVRNKELYETLKQAWEDELKEYTYSHGDLTNGLYT